MSKASLAIGALFLAAAFLNGFALLNRSDLAMASELSAARGEAEQCRADRRADADDRRSFAELVAETVVYRSIAPGIPQADEPESGEGKP